MIRRSLILSAVLALPANGQSTLILPFPESTAYRCSQNPGNNFSHNDQYNQYDFDFALLPGRDVTAAADGTAYIHPEPAFPSTFNTYKAPGKRCIGGPDDGQVCKISTDCSSTICKSVALGNHVTIDHGDNLFTVYGHLESFLISNGTIVIGGERIGKAGNTGNSQANHLHFGLHSGDARKDANDTTMNAHRSKPFPTPQQFYGSPGNCVKPSLDQHRG